MEPIFDARGACVGWFRDDVIYDRTGAAQAFVPNGEIVSFSGHHLGVLDRRLIRDHGGAVVAFLRGGEGGPVLPVSQVPPVPPVPHISPVRPVSPVPPIRAVPQLNWSDLTLETLLRAG